MAALIYIVLDVAKDYSKLSKKRVTYDGHFFAGLTNERTGNIYIYKYI